MISVLRRSIKYSFLLSFLFIYSNAFAAEPQEQEMDVHEALFIEHKYPSATTCKGCHPLQYKEWSASAHAYAQLSPVFNAMHGKINKLTNGTNGDFCIRCHTPVGMDMKEPIFTSNLDRHPVSREGVTCIVCHRSPKAYGKISARSSNVPGDIFEPVYGPFGNEELKRVIESGEFDVNAKRGEEGRHIHTEAREMPSITTSGFCGSCHDVNHPIGFRLEEAFSEYKSSPAARKGISCQDCHMGVEPGVPSGYEQMPVAIIGGKPTKVRKHANHMFVGPDYSIVHPGIFPHNPEAQKVATLRQWLQFNFVEGWGTDDFEDALEDDYEFPERWADASDRYEAREIIDENLELLDEVAEQRKILLQHGYQLGQIIVDKSNSKKIAFRVEVKNATDGHNVPTGFDAERVVFLQVTVTDKDGKAIFKSGDLDPNGDLRDAHSIYVHNNELPRDKQLFNLQSKFLVRMIRGSEREQVLSVNYSPSPLPFLRPPTSSTVLLGRPAGSRKHRKTIRPLDHLWAKYKITDKELKGSTGPYNANIKLIAGMVPVNLVYEIQDVGFDYGMSAREVADAVVDGFMVLWEEDIVLEEGNIVQSKAREWNKDYE